MTVMQDKRYYSSSLRNADNFLKRGGCKMVNNVLAPLNHAKYYDMELDDLKHHIGLRKKSDAYDDILKAFLDKTHAHAKAAGLVKKEKKTKEAKTDDTGLTLTLVEGQIDIDAAKVKMVKIAEKTYFAEGEDPRGKVSLDLQPEPEAPAKKVNPKKLARQAALEASGTAPKKKNADQARADFAAGNAKRTPRIQMKH